MCRWADCTKHVLVSPKQPLHLFETGNILLYLAERSGKFLPTDPAAKAECLNWLFFNVSFGVALLSMMASRAGIDGHVGSPRVFTLCLLLLLMTPNPFRKFGVVVLFCSPRRSTSVVMLLFWLLC